MKRRDCFRLNGATPSRCQSILPFWLLGVAIVFEVLTGFAHANQATKASIGITGQKQNLTPFISLLNLSLTNANALTSIQFTITPKPGSVTRPLSATYTSSYLANRGYLNLVTGQLTLPVFGLYANYTNSVTLTYLYNDNSSQTNTVAIPTAAYTDGCGFTNPIIVQPRTASTNLTYDYILIKSNCSSNSPQIIDSDGEVRWVGTTQINQAPCSFFDNAIYIGSPKLVRNDLDGTFHSVGSGYGNVGVVSFHHNIDYGRDGIILDAHTNNYVGSTNIEVDKDGKLLHIWDLAAIISAAMTAGGDDPSQFVWPISRSYNDWFHNNSTAYRPSDNSLVVSSRENFVIALDYDTGAIKWILGDPTKNWYRFPSLRRYALTVPPGGVPPIGQHGISIGRDDNLLVFDNGHRSDFQFPYGVNEQYSAPRKYSLDLGTNTATEVWNYPRNQSVYGAYCGSIYEDSPLNYLIDYAWYRTIGNAVLAEVIGLDASGQKIFDYAYPADPNCSVAFNAMPVHLENLVFDSGSQAPTPTPAPTATPTPTSTPSPTPTATPTPTSSVQVTIQAAPNGVSFLVDGTTYSSAQSFFWIPGSSHTIGASSPQSGGTGIQYLWKMWNDGGNISHSIAPTTDSTYTVTFSTQFYLTVNAGIGGSVSPASGWRNSGVAGSINAKAGNGYSFGGWTGSGAGSYSGSNNNAAITLNGPITETATFSSNASPTPTPTATSSPTPTATPTPNTTPATPTGLVAAPVSSGEIDLSWTDNSSNETGFGVQRSADGKNFSVIGSVSANVATYRDIGLNPSTKYYYRVAAMNSTGRSNFSNTAPGTTIAPP